MNTRSSNQNREEKIAGIIRKYSKWDVDREWLFNEKRSKNNIFRESFHAINNYIKDEELSLWYLAFGQSFARRTDVMHRKMAEMCTSADLPLITFKKNFPRGCPYSERKDAVIKKILASDFTRSNEEIIKEIKECYRSEKLYHEGVWCRKDEFENCQYRNECPVNEWEKLINEFRLPFRTAPKMFFYYDSFCLLNNSEVSSFDQLFSKLSDLIDDTTKRTIVIKSLLEGIRGIATKTLLFLQMENIFKERELDYSELIFVDSHAIRVSQKMRFPYYEHDLVEAIRKFGKRYNLTARQIDLALWEMGFLCTDEGCLRDDEKLYLFNWDNVPGSESEKLQRFLIDDCDIDWAEEAEINKINDNKIIQIRKDENIAQIILDEKKEKASLEINNDRNLNLMVKRKNGKLNVYKECIFYDVCTNANF